MSDVITIRNATVSDAAELLKIYAPYVRETAITFEYDVPSIEDFSERIRHTLSTYPYLVAECNGIPSGYAYLGAFNERAAYAHSAETSIYVAKNLRHQGIGGKLYKELESISLKMGILNLNACIGYPSVDDEEDPYLNRNSPEFHRHLGYSLVGRFHKCGYKFGRWYDMIWMEKLIGSHGDEKPDFVPFPKLK
jgi:L-amino acid N-acyltransferase YncA